MLCSGIKWHASVAKLPPKIKKKKKLNDVLQALGLTTENIPVKVEFTKSSDSSRMQAQI